MEPVEEQPAAEAAGDEAPAEPPAPEVAPPAPEAAPPPPAPAAPAAGFALPVVTKARQLSEAPELADLVSKLLDLAQEPVTATLAVAEALARKQPGRFATAQALLQQALQEHSLSTKTPRVKGGGAATARAAPPAAANGARAKPPAARAPAAASPTRAQAAPPPPAARPKPAAPPRKPAATTPTPRSLLKSESVVSYLQGSKSRDHVAAAGSGDDGSAGEGGSPASAPASKPKPRGAAPKAAASAPARRSDPVPPKGTVDVDAWLAERRQKDEQRDKVRWARVHNDARFIEKLERQQEVRNRQLHEEEEARAKAAAAAANWNTVPFAPVETKTEGVPAATEEEQLFRKDAARLFGAQPVTPPNVPGRS